MSLRFSSDGWSTASGTFPRSPPAYPTPASEPSSLNIRPVEISNTHEDTLHPQSKRPELCQSRPSSDTSRFKLFPACATSRARVHGRILKQNADLDGADCESRNGVGFGVN